jgi:cytochrome c oxidase subunit 2
VLHEFWVAQLARKMTTVPGHPNHIWLEADTARAATRAVARNFAGPSTPGCAFTVVAQPPAEFAAWEKAQLQPPPPPTERRQGEQLFMQMSCVNCHAINGTPAQARVGPDLTHLASRPDRRGHPRQYAGEPAPLAAQSAEVKPGVEMPNFKFTDEQ